VAGPAARTRRRQRQTSIGCGGTDAGEEISRREELHIDEDAIEKRYNEFKEETAGTASMKSRCATTLLYTKFLKSRKTGRSVEMGESQPRDVVDYLCWLDSCSKRRRTVVHARDCTAVGTSSLEECSTEKGACTKRYAHDSLRTNHVSKLAVAFEKEMGCTHDWDSQRRTGNPVRSELVAQYMRFTTRQQKRAGVLVKQAPAILRSHLHQMIVPMRIEIDVTTSKMNKVIVARDVAFFMVAFNTTKRGEELASTLIQRILRLPNRSGLMFNFQWGKTQRDGADHVVSVEYDVECLPLCPVGAVERYVAVGQSMGWDMTSGYLFSAISEKKGGHPKREPKPVTASHMTASLKRYAKAVGLEQEFSVHSFRAGGAISRALAGESMSAIMQRAYWKNPKTAWRYMRLMEVVAPGAGTEGMVEGVSEDQYRQLNEFPLSEQSRSLAAFGDKPLI